MPENIRVSGKSPKPQDRLPVARPDFSAPNRHKLYVTWFGHSTVLFQMHGVQILIDPIFSKHSFTFQIAAPARFTVPSVGIADLPQIDAVLLTHDHYDHLDRNTIRQLAAKTDRFIVSRGLAAYLRRWGIPKRRIIPLAWWEKTAFRGLEITCTPSRHFSGRGLFDQNTTQWCSFVLRDGLHTVFDSGDGSIGGHFKEIHDRFGDFDFAVMECGQYNRSWHYSHLYPEESVQAALAVGAKYAMPVHWGAYVLSNHGWDDPPARFAAEAEKQGLSIITPHICETVCIDDAPETEYWWNAYQ